MTGAHVLTLGESMLRMTAQRTGPMTHSAAADIGFGGAESNVAIGLSRLGVATRWVSRLGDDEAGDLITRELTAEGVEVVAERDQEAPTGLMLKVRRTPATARVTYYRAGSAASRLSPRDISEAAFTGVSLVHLTGITPALSPSCAAATKTAIAHAHRAGAQVSFDVNYRASLWEPERAREFYASVLPQIDILFAGPDEAALALGVDGEPDALAAQLHQRGPRTVVVKMGARGAIAHDASGTHAMPAIPITPTDTVGAGDAFVAGYLAAHMDGAQVPDCLALAVRTAAFVCLGDGDWEGAPRHGDLALLEADEPVTR